MSKGKTADQIDAEMAAGTLTAAGAVDISGPVGTRQTALLPADRSEWDLLTAGSVSVDGYDLVDKKEHMIGMPFVITGVTFRDGIPRKAAQGNKLVEVPSNYVSLEIMLGDSLTLNRAYERGKITADQRRLFDPLERLVINDGSTGVCRQITAYLAAQNTIVLPADRPEAGPAGESRYDTYRADWVRPVDPDADAIHFALGEQGVAPSLVCKRGLRQSEYDANGQPSVTFYLA